MRVFSTTLFCLASLAMIITTTSCGGPDTRTLKPGQPEIVSAIDLRSFARSNSFPVYWAGAIKGFNIELTQTGDGQVFVRYLPAKVTAGDRRLTFLTVASYPEAGAWNKLQQQKKRAGAVLEKIPGGGIMLWYKNNKRSAYLAWPGSNTLVEVYWPYGPQALIRKGQIGPVE